MNCVAEDRRLFGITGDWSTAALDHVARYDTQVSEEGCRFIWSCMHAGEGK